MINEEKLYSLKDICVIPAPITTINSRSECKSKGFNLEGTEQGFLPLVSAPMSCVLYGENYLDFLNNGISCVIPRTFSLERRLELMKRTFCAFSLEESEFINSPGFVCLDMANGHMKSQLDAGLRLKLKFGDSIKVMGGNIANPETYIEYKNHLFDYVRCGIGGGNGCFVEGTRILMADGSRKPINEIKIGDKIINRLGEEDSVIDVICLSSTDFVKINNNIVCTPNHEFYVILKENYDKITEDNLSSYAFWIQAKDLDKNKHLLIKLEDV